MATPPKGFVTVVVPLYNADRFLPQAVESVGAQTHEEWHVVVVDDGSTDRSAQVARELAAGDSRITMLAHPGGANLGPSATRNLGITEAAGDYIAFLDADDVWFPEKLSEQLEALADEPRAAVVFGPTEYWQSWQHGSEETNFVPALGIGPGLVEPPNLLTLSLRSMARTPGPSNVLVRREAVETVGGFEESRDLGMYEDQAFLAKLFLRYPVLVSEQCWDRYRLHPGQRSVGRPFAEKRKAALVYFDWLERYLEENDIREPSLHRALRQKRRRYRFPSWNRIFLRAREARKTLWAS